MNLSLKNKNAIICGSTQGIGLAIAKELAKLGANCILLARNEDALKKALLSLEKPYSQRHKYLVADFADAEKVKTVVESVVAASPVHILINNTGGPSAGPVADATPAAFLRHSIYI